MTSKECEICAREFLPGEKKYKSKNRFFYLCKACKTKERKKELY